MAASWSFRDVRSIIITRHPPPARTTVAKRLLRSAATTRRSASSDASMQAESAHPATGVPQATSFSNGHAESFLNTWIHEYIGGGICLCKPLGIAHALQSDDLLWKPLYLPLVQSNKNDNVMFIQLARQFHEIPQPLPLRPRTCNAENHEAVPDAIALAEVARSGLEHGSVYLVVLHRHRVFGQKRLTHEVGEPLRRRDQLHALGRNEVEETLLVLEVSRARAP